jgi:hypothetical protein
VKYAVKKVDRRVFHPVLETGSPKSPNMSLASNLLFSDIMHDVFQVRLPAAFAEAPHHSNESVESLMAQLFMQATSPEARDKMLLSSI